MGAAKRIVEELKTGVSPEVLARKIPWKDLSGNDGDDLLEVALRLGDNQQSYNLLVYLFHISFGKDLWFSTEVLTQAVQHPNMTLLDRKAILPTMRNRLDQIKDQIGTKIPTEERLTKYWLMEATYYSVNGNLLSETGNRVEATHNYQIAQSIFEQLGLFQKAAEYKTLNRRLLSKEAGKSPLPKTSPIRLNNLPPTQPLTTSMSAIQAQPKAVESDQPAQSKSLAEASEPTESEKPAEAASQVEPSQPLESIPLAETDRPAELDQPAVSTPLPEAEKPVEFTPKAQTEKPVPPFIDENESERAPIPTVIQLPPPPTTAPFTTDAPMESAATRVTTRLVSPEAEPEAHIEAAPSRPSAGSPVNTVLMEPEPKKLHEVSPAIPEAGKVDEKVIQVSEEVQPAEEIQIAPPPAKNSPVTTSAAPQPVPQGESPSVSGIYYPLPDVWLEEGRLRILGVDQFRGDPAADQSEQIRQQCDILIGIQLQIKMYMTRRKMLEQEMKSMEVRANALRAKIEKLESKVIKLESAEEIPSI